MISFPHSFEGQTTVEGAPLVADRPDGVVLDAEPLLARGSYVLDVGSGRGTNGTYLAFQGHKVHSLELNSDYLENGRRIIGALGGLATANTMVQGDMRDLNFREEFDAVIATRTLQLIAKPEAYQVIHKMREATKPGGLNIINAFVAEPDQQAEMPNFALFEHSELKTLYKAAGWGVISFKSPNERVKLDYTGAVPGCGSKAQLIARKPVATETVQQALIAQAKLSALLPNSNEARKRELIALAQNYYRSDPEHYDDLMEEAAAL
jgi:SAM-dependent methyltransferase